MAASGRKSIADGAMKVLISRTVLNGGEREQEHSSDTGGEGSKPGPT